jgi:hypothetical protein
LENEIIGLANKIDHLVIQINGGRERVNSLRDEHNKKMGF